MQEKNFKTRYVLFKPKMYAYLMIDIIRPHLLIFNLVKFVINYVAIPFVINVFVKKRSTEAVVSHGVYSRAATI